MQQVIEVNNEQNINLAFMECFTSCVLTYLNIQGKDYRKILLSYWNLSYQFKTLLSGKEARQLPLEYFYGLKMTFIKGDEESLKRYIRSGHSAICLCQASKLEFFPRSFLGMEESGFQHSILLYGWDEQQERYLVTDPVVNMVVTLSPDELTYASAIRLGSNEVHYFVMEDSVVPFSEPNLESCLIHCTEQMLTLYRNQRKSKSDPIIPKGSSHEQKVRAWQHWFNNRHGGIRALEHFEEDLRNSDGWTIRRRNDWIVINTKTITSIRRLRSVVWNTYQDMADFSVAQEEEGQRQIDAILAMWNLINFLLLKYKSGQNNQAVVPSILVRIDELKRIELQFLEWLYLAIREGAQ
ncbi:hypothetical protein [Paenibacillus oryzisoli]|uniref:Butirosin biosynthesis protein H N-terminal domain-containing protein n=1 Tax=Paenibacillus oryzisoli TaxID=1850517 RepID=A0A198A9U3_9BACL|nr:hypothetical protein [Paenibacillus oryzisoli]OAS17723.1 hypothetical protein A8708_14615 [Paenibacillus oryzisoli]